MKSKVLTIIMIFLGIFISIALMQNLFENQRQRIKIGLVTDVGGLAVGSFSESAWQGIEQYRALQRIDVNYVEIFTSEERLTKLNEQAKKNDIVVVPGADFREAIVTSAKTYPQTQYILLDAQPAEQLPNIITLEFKEEQAGYLAGVAAALTTKTNKIAFLGGIALPSVQDFAQGYLQGVAAINSTISVEVVFADTFTDSDKGYQLAQGLYDQGYDVIFSAAGTVGQGVIDAAKVYTQAKKPVWVIGVDRDQFEEGLYAPGKSVVLTSAIKHTDRAIAELIAQILEGTVKFGTTQVLDITTGAVGLPRANPNLSAEAEVIVLELAQKLSTGQIIVQTNPPLKEA